MNYELFSNIFRALMSAEAVAVKIGDLDLKVKTEKAKESILTEFDQFFPSSVSDLLKRPNPDCKPLFAIMAEFPFLVKGHERKYLQLIANISLYQKLYEDEEIIMLDVNALKIIASSFIDDYVWKFSKDSKISEEFFNGINAVLPLLTEEPYEKWEINLVEVLLPAWGQAFPEISEAIRLATEKRKNQIRSECWV